MAQEGMSGQHHATAALYPQEWTPGIHWIRCWVALRSDLDTETEENALLLSEIEPRSSSMYSDTVLTALPRFYELLGTMQKRTVNYRAKLRQRYAMAYILVTGK
jgi:hypothetical protein